MTHFNLPNSSTLSTIIVSCCAALSVASHAHGAFTDDDWSPLGGMGTNDVIFATATDAAGNLYIGGHFSSVGGVAANNIARWNGHTWSALGSGLNDWVNVVAVRGDNLYVGGYFTNAGGHYTCALARARIDPAPPPMLASFASIEQSVTGTQMVFTVTAEPGTAYDLLSSSNLAGWDFKSTLYAAGPTNTFWINTTRPREFYRLRQIQ